MTTRGFFGSADLQTGPPLPGQLIDDICEVIGHAQTPGERSAVVRALVDEICQAVEWRHPPDEGSWELASLERILMAAREHDTRMAVSMRDSG